MHIKCPKCGFDQPKDTYCANCGIEMDSYKPIKPPLWKQILKSPIVPLLIFVGLGYGAYLYLKNPSQVEFPQPRSQFSYRDTLSESENEARKDPSGENLYHSSTAHENSPNASPSAQSAPPLTPSPQNARVSPTTTTSSLPSPSSANTPETSERSTRPKEDSALSQQETTPPIESITGPLTVEVRFIEAPQNVIQAFLSEASEHAAGDTGEMNFAIVKNAAAWTNHKSFKELDHLSKKVPEVKKKLQWFSGTHEPQTGVPFGFDFQIAVQERMGGHLAGDLFISRSMMEYSGAQIETRRKEFTTHFETDVGSLIGLTGVVPRIRYKAEDRDLLQDSLLKIFLSPDFLERESDLLILFQFKGETKTNKNL